MEITITCRLAGAIATLLRASREELTRRWLDRIADRVSLAPNRIFPTEQLLDHIPLLIDGIADYLEDPADEITADMPVLGKAMELGRLRHEQGFSAHQILREYELLGGVIFAFIVREVDAVEEPCTRSELFACAHRLFRAVAVIQQVTATQYLRETQAKVGQREERLRSFNRLVSHELKNRIGAVRNAALLLRDDALDQEPAKREKFLSIIIDNVDGIHVVLENLMLLSRTHADTRQQQHVRLPDVVAETFRQLREMAAAGEVKLRTAGEIPAIEVNAAALELCLVNYVSNGIKYADPHEATRWVEVSAAVEATAGETMGDELVIRVRDNGIGVEPGRRDRLFERFYRAHPDPDSIEGSGLGLSLVRETAESMGGRVWAEFSGVGSTFAIALPLRRQGDAAPASGLNPEGTTSDPAF